MEVHKFLGLFSKNETDKIEVLKYHYIERKKVITYVPLNYVDKLTFEMSFAGAGRIGNYDMCSFRMKGLGTYLPGSKSNPFAGKKGKLSFEEEVRLEIETSEHDLDKVIDALLSNHPYEEVAYEVYDFKKRSGEPSTVFISFKKPMVLKDIISRVNRKILSANLIANAKLKNICFTDNTDEKMLASTLKEKNCKLLVISEQNKIKFKYI